MGVYRGRGGDESGSGQLPETAGEENRQLASGPSWDAASADLEFVLPSRDEDFPPSELDSLLSHDVRRGE